MKNSFPTIIPVDISKISKREALIYKAFRNGIAFGKLFDPGNFMKSATPDFHRVIFINLEEQTTDPLAVIIARGHAKTTLTKCFLLKRICFARKAYEWGFTDKPEELFIGWVSDNQSKSKNNIRYIRQHITFNEQLIYYFGDLKGDIWSKEDLSFANGSRLLSRSSLTSIRGETQTSKESGELRYSYVIADDVENEDNVKTKNSRENIQNVIMNGVFPAIDNHTGRFIWIGTPIHRLAFTQRILDQYHEHKKKGTLNEFTWKVLEYKATQPDMEGGVLWNSYMPKEKLEKKKQMYRDSPKGIAGYYQEYELEVEAKGEKYWNEKHINYWKGNLFIDEDGDKFIELENEDKPRFITTFIGVDPATDIESFDSDYSVIMAIAVDYYNNVYVLGYIMRRSIPSRGRKDKNGRLLPDARKGVVDYMFDTKNQIQANGMTVEDVSMNRSIFNDYEQEQYDRNDYNLPIQGQKTGGQNKYDRIYSWLNSHFSAGKVYIRASHDELEKQIITFGANMGHDDVIDALSYAVVNSWAPNIKTKEDIKKRRSDNYKKAKSWECA